MPRKWTKEEEDKYRKELIKLYVTQNLTISEKASFLSLSEKTIFQRLQRLNIQTAPERKKKYCNKRNDITIPKNYSSKLAELLGILYGDGHINKHQVTVTLGNKEDS